MRRMLEDYHEYVRLTSFYDERDEINNSPNSCDQEIAATCLFLASKTEENGKRLEDLVTVALAKLHSIAPSEVAGAYDNVSKPRQPRFNMSLGFKLKVPFRKPSSGNI